MKNLFARLALAAATGSLLISIQPILAQGTAFTYQGQLSASGSLTDGNYDFTFALFNNNSTNTGQVGVTQTNLDVGVTNGLFIAMLNFGTVFNGNDTWLAIGVRSNGGSSFTALNPLQELTPTPYAVYAPTAGNAATATTAGSANSVAAADITGTVLPAQLPASVVTNTETGVTLGGTFSGNGANLISLNADNLSSGTVPLAQLSGITSSQLATATWQVATNLNGGNAALASNVVSGIDITNAVITNSSFAGNGGGLTNLNASQLSSGVIPLAQLPGAVVTNNDTISVNLTGTFNGNGANLISLNADNLSSGTVPLAQLSGITSSQLAAATWQVATNLNGGNAALASNVVSGIDITNAFITNAVITNSSFAGNGGGLTNLNASQLSGGTIPLAQLPSAVITNNETGAVTLNGTLNLPSSVTINAGAGLFLYSDGNANFFAGPNAGNSSITGRENTGIGEGALFSGTTGVLNTAIGYQALFFNTSGGYNTACGMEALYDNRIGSYNTAIGNGALSSHISGSNNTATGYFALAGYFFPSGNNNTANGYEALALSGGTNNIALGYLAGYGLGANESSNIDIGNAGFAGDYYTIRIGDPAVHTNAVIAGVINGNGAGLTNLNGADLNAGSVSSTQLAAGAVGTTQLAAGAQSPPVSISGTTRAAAPNSSYVATSASLTTINLPTTANVGDVVQVNGAGAGGWQVAGDINGYQEILWTLQTSGLPGFASWQSVASSSDASHLVAVAYAGGLYTSTNGGASWTLQTSGLPGSPNWNSVASSSDGSHLVAVIAGGGIYTSANTGAKWMLQTDGLPASGVWFSVASSSDGSQLVAMDYGGGIYTSANTGANWTLQSSGLPASAYWKSVASSSDGSHLVAVANGGGIYTSPNSGTNWTLQSSGLPASAFWYFIASSSDGSHLVAVGNSGGIYTSANSGANWMLQTDGLPASAFWYSVASSSDGSHLVAANEGGIYTSTETSAGSPGSSEQFEYVGNGVWQAVTSTGNFTGTFTGNGSGLTNLTAAYLTGALPAISGANLTSLNASQLTGGPVPTSVLSGFQSPNYASIGGGQGNTISSGTWTVIGGGQNNSITGGNQSTIGGGIGNVVSAIYATVGGGQQNTNTSQAGTVAGGQNNLASGQYQSTVGGGFANQATNSYATVPGGYGNLAGGLTSFAAGSNAKATNQGSFVWSDNSSGTAFTSTANNQVSFRCVGGVLFASGNNGTDQTVSWTPGAASWSFSSDRNLKDRFEEVDAASVLDKVSQLPIMEWSYKGFGQRHIGAMAQDFHQLFPLNENDKALNDADLHGVELAAIQGLNQKLETETKAKDAEIQTLRRQNDSLSIRLNELEATVKRLAAQK
jgi:hypothetical protein